MEVIIQPDVAATPRLAARLIARRLHEKPDAALGLATGPAPWSRCTRIWPPCTGLDGLDFAGVRTFNLDEYIGIPPDDDHSYRYYMNHHLFQRVNIDPRNTHLPDGMATDVKRACRDYEAAISAAGGIDLQLLGISNT